MRLSLRSLSCLAAATAAALILAGCGSGTDSEAEGPTDAEADAGASAAFPVTLTDAFGSATIEEEPERVVTIGWGSQDAAAALGTVPVATTDFTWGSVDKYLPWFADRVDELGGELPEILRYTDNDEIDFEQVLALDPDLILAVHSGLTENEYERLSEIAPTVGFQDRAWTSDWTELTRTVGAALGKSDEADALVEQTEAAIAEQAAAHPEFEGRTFTYGWYLADGATALDLYVPEDPRVQLVEQLGFTVSPQVVELSTSADDFYVSVSLEELADVQSDFHLAWVDQPGDLERTIDNELVSQWEPIANDSYYFMDDQALAWASSQPSVLSIPWQLDEVVPIIAERLAPPQ